MKTPMSPITGISEEPLGTGRLFAPPPEAQGAPDTGQLFAEEVDEAIARQGGERSVESRQAALRARRAIRRESFEGDTESRVAQSHEPEELSSSDGPGIAPTQTVLASPPDGRGKQAPASAPGNDAGAVSSYKEGASGSTHMTPAPEATPHAPQVEMAQLARMAVQAGTKAAGMQPVRGTGEARVEATTQAFLDAARGSSSKGSGRTAATSTPAMSDPELIERASEIMRQIRLSIAPGATQVTLDLEPTELGRLWIRMSLRGGKVGAHVRVEKPETLDVLAPKLDELRQLFAERGIEADTIELELGFGGESSDSEPGSSAGRSPRYISRNENPTREFAEGNAASVAPRHVPPDADGIDTYA